MTDRSEDQNKPTSGGKVNDYLANERTYLAWLRTGIATIGLGFVVAKFGLAIRALTGISAIPETTYHFSSIIGIALTIAGGLMLLLAFRRFQRNQERIRSGVYEPSSAAELTVTVSIFIIALLLIAYLLLTY